METSASGIPPQALLNDSGNAMALALATTPLFIIFSALVMITLIALTMRAVIRREKAMIKSAMDEPHEIAAYQQRWRSAA